MRGLEIILPWLANAAGVLALVLLPWGWRGRRASDHPHCRRCGFDLFGLPKTSHQCSECGADLDQRKAIRDGWRERYRGLVRAGWLLLLACGGFWGYTTTQRLRNLPAADKPTWWVLINAKSKTPAVEQAAMAELIARYDRRGLTPKQTSEFLMRMLEMQGRPGRRWSPDHDRVIEHAHANGFMGDDMWDRYLRQTVRFTFLMRSRNRPGEPLPFEIGMDCLPSAVVRVSDFSIGECEIAGVSLPRPDVTDFREYGGRFGGVTRNPRTVLPSAAVKGGDISLPQQVREKLPPGPNTVRIRLDVDFAFVGGHKGKMSQRLSMPVEAPLTLVAPGMPPGNLLVPLGHQTTMRLALNIRRTGSPRRQQFAIDAERTPLPIAAQVWIRGDGRERFAGTLCNLPDSRWSRMAVCDLTDFECNYVDVVLRPDPELAIETIQGGEIWGEEILLQHVRVR